MHWVLSSVKVITNSSDGVQLSCTSSVVSGEQINCGPLPCHTQLSGMASHSTVMSLGIVMSASNSGFCVSTTCTWKLHVAMLPWMSVALYVIVTGGDTGITVPFTGPPVCTIDKMSQLSSATGIDQFTFAEHWSTSLPTITIVTGQLMNSGASVSVTTTVIEHVAVLPDASVTVHTTVVVPTGNVAPASVHGFGAVT
ncbi:MAG: hypothetical protein PGMFKBFP_02403 [Anaerolineales bacterium]|nr:hypothetical protein [Anaerolineales bacterium]